MTFNFISVLIAVFSLIVFGKIKVFPLKNQISRYICYENTFHYFINNQSIGKYLKSGLIVDFVVL